MLNDTAKEAGGIAKITEIGQGGFSAVGVRVKRTSSINSSCDQSAGPEEQEAHAYRSPIVLEPLSR